MVEVALKGKEIHRTNGSDYRTYSQDTPQSKKKKAIWTSENDVWNMEFFSYISYFFILGTKKANFTDQPENIPKVKHDGDSIILWGCV